MVQPELLSRCAKMLCTVEISPAASLEVTHWEEAWKEEEEAKRLGGLRRRIGIIWRRVWIPKWSCSSKFGSCC